MIGVAHFAVALGPAAQTDALLRGSATGPRLHTLFLLLVLCGGVYGAVMGSYGVVLAFDPPPGGAALAGGRGWQVLISASKVPLLLLATFFLALPSFFVLNTLLGVRADFPRVLRALVAAQTGLTVVLVALAPYTALWYFSFADYRPAILFNGIMFGLASFAGQWHLRRAYRPLIARNSRHRLLLRGWLVLYIFVGIQMGWVLRPFIGEPTRAPQFFRQEAWGNAYVVVARMLWETFAK